jgi:hypothetical protein
MCWECSIVGAKAGYKFFSRSKRTLLKILLTRGTQCAPKKTNLPAPGKKAATPPATLIATPSGSVVDPNSFFSDSDPQIIFFGFGY